MLKTVPDEQEKNDENVEDGEKIEVEKAEPKPEDPNKSVSEPKEASNTELPEESTSEPIEKSVSEPPEECISELPEKSNSEHSESNSSPPEESQIDEDFDVEMAELEELDDNETDNEVERYLVSKIWQLKFFTFQPPRCRKESVNTFYFE